MPNHSIVIETINSEFRLKDIPKPQGYDLQFRMKIWNSDPSMIGLLTPDQVAQFAKHMNLWVITVFLHTNINDWLLSKASEEFISYLQKLLSNPNQESSINIEYDESISTSLTPHGVTASESVSFKITGKNLSSETIRETIQELRKK